MQIRLTKKGREKLGWSPDRITANVSDDRAFSMMESGYAVEDKGFMSLYANANPAKKPKKKTEKKTPVSRKATVRKKAIKK